MMHMEEYLFWKFTLGDDYKDYEYFYHNATRLAKEHGVARHELTLSELFISIPRSPEG